ncbi:MAG: N-6 DNA methylase [Planctomycetes bacterium]|nr:N-6 DNA methylase [Planctomycetota bacterium]
MSTTTETLVKKLWSHCNVLRDEGLSYGDYLEQLSLLLFLKMAHEQTQPPWSKPSPVPDGLDWSSLVSKRGTDLEKHYSKLLGILGKKPGFLGLIYRGARNKINDPARLRRLIVDLLDREQWMRVGLDVKGDAYEGLLERNAQDTKSGAGQYFTPRPLIDAIVDCINPRPGETVIDPACGTGGFLLAAHAHVSQGKLKREDREHLRLHALRGIEIVASVTRLCAMNLLLHGVGPTPQELEKEKADLIASGKTEEQVNAEIEGDLPVARRDALKELGNERFDVVLTNPPFGRKSSVLVVTDEGETERQSVTYQREDFWTSTSNKQLNFVQHVKSLLKINGRAAVVIPDNVLFETGAGETIRRKLLHECDVHTLLRLPTGLFYAQGVKANVLFFDRKPASPDPATKKTWVYDLRTNKRFTLKTRPMKRADLDEFLECYVSGRNGDHPATWDETKNPEGPWRCYDHAEIAASDACKLDLTWLRDDSVERAEDLPPPEELLEEIQELLAVASVELEALAGILGGEV